MIITHASLFSGIGGFDLAAEMCDMQNVFHCEWNEFGKKILKYYWPKSISYDDITKTDFTIHRGTIDILSGGFPCQPYSHAGKRKGKNDERHLWPQMLRAICEIQPIYVVGENVPGIISWSTGLVFNEVQTDLENEGYEILPFILPACSVGAPHLRNRVFFIAYSATAHAARNGHQRGQFGEDRQTAFKGEKQGDKWQRFWNDNCRNGTKRITPYAFGNGQSWEEYRRNRKKALTELDGFCLDGDATNSPSKQCKSGKFKQRNVSQSQQREFRGVNSQNGGGYDANTNGSGWEKLDITPESNKSKFCNRCGNERNVTYSNGGRQPGQEHREAQSGWITETGVLDNWRNFPTQSPVCGRNDGVSGKLDGITLPRWTKETIKAYGNAVVPQLIIPIFKTIIFHLKK